jgi:hypothetical protein
MKCSIYSQFVGSYLKDSRIDRIENSLRGEKMTEIWGWMFRLKKKNKLLNSLQEKARQNPQNCQAQVRLGDLLTKMGKKEAAIEVYHAAAEKFAQHGFMVEAIAMSKVIMRLDPLQKGVQKKISKLYRQWEALKEEKGKPDNKAETNQEVGEDIWLRKEKVTE